MKNNEEIDQKQDTSKAKLVYKTPELKKHGKLKNKATQVSTYTYTTLGW